LRWRLADCGPPSNVFSGAFSGYKRAMLHYLYLDYGGLAKYRRELRYSLISLKAELDDAPDAKIVIYTDAPTVYARWPVEVVDISAHIQAWSGDGLYHHRIKPAVVLDALKRFDAPASWTPTPSSSQASMPR
jgi:hypothetical protein